MGLALPMLESFAERLLPRDIMARLLPPLQSIAEVCEIMLTGMFDLITALFVFSVATQPPCHIFLIGHLY